MEKIFRAFNIRSSVNIRSGYQFSRKKLMEFQCEIPSDEIFEIYIYHPCCFITGSITVEIREETKIAKEKILYRAFPTW